MGHNPTMSYGLHGRHGAHDEQVVLQVYGEPRVAYPVRGVHLD